MLVPSFLVTALLALEGAEAEYEQIRGGGGPQNFLGPRGVKYLNTVLPTCFGIICTIFRELTCAY
jgi:hypothetical protein